MLRNKLGIFLTGSVVMLSGINANADDLSKQPGIVRMEFIFDKAPFQQCHASTIAQTTKGLVAAWFGGTHESHSDVGIWMSRSEGSKWTRPVQVADGIQHTKKRYPCWNPVLYQSRFGLLLLFYKVGPSHRKLLKRQRQDLEQNGCYLAAESQFGYRCGNARRWTTTAGL